MSNFISNGGGATHVAKVTGQLSSLSSNLSDILIVSGGGGGGFITPGSSDLQPYIDKLKVSAYGTTNQITLLQYSISNASYTAGTTISNIYSFITGSNFNSDSGLNSLYLAEIGIVDITISENAVTASYDFTNAPSNCLSITYRDSFGSWRTKSGNYATFITVYNNWLPCLDGDMSNLSNDLPTFTTSFNTMKACLQYLTQHFRHINVTVNGIPWEAYLNHVYSGADAGGISGSGTKSANQSTGYAFGQGESGTDVSGGGSGLYGGYKGVTDPGVPSAVATYLNKLASFTAHTNDGRDLSMLYYMDAGPYRNYDLTRPYSATYIWSYDNGSFNFVNGRVYEFMLFDNGRLNLTVDSSTGATTLSFSGFATPTQMPLVYQSNGYNYAYGLGWIGGRLSVSTLGTSAFDGTRYTTSFNSVAACLSYCADHFRNVEVYVNGVAWVTIDDTKYAHLIIPLSGGAGSGYIGNEFLSNKKMVGFNVPTSSTASTKTESVQTCNISPYADTPKVGNGFATIKFLSSVIIPDEYKPYLDLINGCNGDGYDFFWKNQTINFPLGGYKDPKMFSYYLERRSYPPSSIVPFAFQAGVQDSQGYGSGYGAYHTSLFSLWIINESGTYKLYFRNYHRYVLNVNIDTTDPLYGRYYRGNYKTSGGSWGTFWWDNDRASSSPSTYVEGDSTVRATNSTLAGLLDWCAKHFRNVNIYVDRILWSKGG